MPVDALLTEIPPVLVARLRSGDASSDVATIAELRNALDAHHLDLRDVAKEEFVSLCFLAAHLAGLAGRPITDASLWSFLEHPPYEFDLGALLPSREGSRFVFYTAGVREKDTRPFLRSTMDVETAEMVSVPAIPKKK